MFVSIISSFCSPPGKTRREVLNLELLAYNFNDSLT